MAVFKLHRKKGARRAFMKILAHNLILREKIETTTVRAKALRPLVERMVTIGKKQNVSALRLLMSRLSKVAAYKVYHDISPRYAKRNGGYTRITKEMKTKKRDGSRLAVIEFV